MTVIIGALCQDGVVVGSDSSATFVGGTLPTIEQPVRKMCIVGNDIILAGTGQVGLGQRFKIILSELQADPKFSQLGHMAIAKKICASTVNDFASTGCKSGQFGALVAFPCGDAFHLCEFSINDFQPEFKTSDMWFVSMGSGQPITDPFLGLIRRVFFQDSQPRLNEGVFSVTWALLLAIELNTGGINGPHRIAVLAWDSASQSFSARLLSDDELLEHEENVRSAEKHLASYRECLSGGGEQQIPDL